MEFTPFTVVNTNIFPVANSHAGGQLATEYNLKSRESVATDSNVKYAIGPSYTHGLDDFYVTASGMTLTVAEGRAVVNGHFIESLSSFTIDISEVVTALQQLAPDFIYRPTAGLSIGLKANYSTLETLSGSMLAEDLDGVYQGISVVVLPTFNDSAYDSRSVNTFNTPSDVPNDSGLVTAHLLLATFSFVNGAVRNLPDGNNSDKIRAFSADRISNIDSSLSSDYVRKDNLQSNKLYTFSGKSKDWCNSVDSLMVWDEGALSNNPTTTVPTVTEARFTTDGNNVYLEVPHKQVDGLEDNQHRRLYYQPKRYTIPKANFDIGTPGIVDAEYSATLKKLSDRFNELYSLGNGTYLKYIPQLADRTYDPNNADSTLPPILATWNIGDYILVGQDNSVEGATTEDGTVKYPSTMYLIVGAVAALEGDNPPTTQPSSGVNLGTFTADEDDHPDTDEEAKSTFLGSVNQYGSEGDYFTYKVVGGSSYYYVVTSTNKQYSDPIYLTGQMSLATETTIGGFLNVPTTQTDAGYVYRDEYGYLRLLDYELLRSGTLAYQLGANYTMPNGLDSETIQSYLDEYVNERVAFPNAQQLAYASATGAPIDVIDVTIYLPKADDTTVINIYDLDSRFSTCTYFHILGEADSKTTVNFVNCQRIRIDQNIGGSPIINLQNTELYYDAVTLNYIMNCPRSESTYQTMGTDYTGIKDLKLWYKQYSDDNPEIYVDGMTVISPDIAADVASADYWSSNTANDYHYVYALKSVTFDDTCKMIGCEMLIKNDTTATALQTGTQILSGEYSLPQSTRLIYPEASIRDNIKIDGCFVTAYNPEGQSKYITMRTTFTAVSGVASYSVVNTRPNNWETAYVNYYRVKTVYGVDIYTSLITESSAPDWSAEPYYSKTSATGNIAILVEIQDSALSNLNAVSGTMPEIPGWSTSSYHTFIGGVSQ